MNKPKFFISYAHNDYDWANALAKALQDQGASVWLDNESIRVGDSLEQAVEQGLRRSDWIVFLLNLENSSRPSVLFEIGAAVGMGKRIVPVFPADLEPSRIPYPLRLRQGLVRESPQETAKKLIASAQAALSHDES